MEIDKYALYEESVQCVENDVEFINKEFQRWRERSPLVLREDFGGTGQLCCEWVKQGSQHYATAVDLDPEPIEWGKERHWAKLEGHQKERVSYELRDVLEAEDIRADAVVAFNFSYFIFKERKTMVDYFRKVRESLNDDGIFFLDLFGGYESQQEVEEETEYDDFSYFWDCDKFDPINHDCVFKIHFKPKGKKKIEDVFVYEWRFWTLPELMDCLKDAGFSRIIPYWEEDDDEDDEGSGVFYPTEGEENCESWVTYIAAFN